MMPAENILRLLDDLQFQVALQVENASRYDHDTVYVWEDLYHDLEVAVEGVRKQDWRGVFDTIRHAELALDGDWTWRES